MSLIRPAAEPDAAQDEVVARRRDVDDRLRERRLGGVGDDAVGPFEPRRRDRTGDAGRADDVELPALGRRSGVAGVSTEVVRWRGRAWTAGPPAIRRRRDAPPYRRRASPPRPSGMLTPNIGRPKSVASRTAFSWMPRMSGVPAMYVRFAASAPRRSRPAVPASAGAKLARRSRGTAARCTRGSRCRRTGSRCRRRGPPASGRRPAPSRAAARRRQGRRRRRGCSPHGSRR